MDFTMLEQQLLSNQWRSSNIIREWASNRLPTDRFSEETFLWWTQFDRLILKSIQKWEKPGIIGENWNRLCSLKTLSPKPSPKFISNENLENNLPAYRGGIESRSKVSNFGKLGWSAGCQSGKLLPGAVMPTHRATPTLASTVGW